MKYLNSIFTGLLFGAIGGGIAVAMGVMTGIAVAPVGFLAAGIAGTLVAGLTAGVIFHGSTTEHLRKIGPLNEVFSEEATKRKTFTVATGLAVVATVGITLAMVFAGVGKKRGAKYYSEAAPKAALPLTYKV